MREQGETVKPDRRRVLLTAVGLGAGAVGTAVLGVHLMPPGATVPSAKDAAQNLIVRSGLGAVPHTHDLLIPRSLLHAPPPQGVRLQTTRTLQHAHEVVLTQAQLLAVSQGGTVTATGGSHTFVIVQNG